MATAGYLYGAQAQEAAEAEVARQGVPAGVLAQNRVNFKERGVEILLPMSIAVCLATLATLNLTGSGFGRILSLTFQPIVLVIGGVVTGFQVFAVRYIERLQEGRRRDATEHQRKVIRACRCGFFPLVVPLSRRCAFHAGDLGFTARDHHAG
jgi:hypothetical protein